MRIAIKIGTSTLTYPSGQMNIRRVEALCKVLSDIRNSGHELVVISSGAIGMGVGKLKLSERPNDMPTRQAAAAVGQCELMYFYDKLFTEYNYTTAQILLTAEDMQRDRHPERLQNFVNTINRLLELGVIPIINENDTVATEEIAVGDNDHLGAQVAVTINAELLVILTDTNGLYTSDPHQNSKAKRILEVRELTDDIRKLAAGRGSALGTGGMVTKIDAAELCMNAGIDVVITSGFQPSVLYEVLDEQPVGTRFIAKAPKEVASIKEKSNAHPM